MSEVWYDNALPRFAALVEKLLGSEALVKNLFLRDATGLLTFVLIQDVTAEERKNLTVAAQELWPYVDHVAVCTPEDLFDESFRDPCAGVRERLEHEDFEGIVRLVERRIAGHDWLTRPCRPLEGVPPVFAYVSHKGGVGRSTALAVTAAQLAMVGRNVLVVDLDLEAPGLGYMLLPEDRLPRFGSLDFFVENGLRALDDAFFEELIGISPLTTGSGRVEVVPAVGRASEQYPENVLGKLSRAYLEDVAPGKPARSFLLQTQDLLKALCERRSYDVVLVDARAGLNETTAAVVLGLGAYTLLFGIDTPQTIKGYHYLLKFLARYAEEHPSSEDEQGEWRERLRMVHAKASAHPEHWKLFRERAYDLFAETLYTKADESASEGSHPFNFDLDVSEAPHTPWRILNDTNYLSFDPLNHREHLDRHLYERTFGHFLQELQKFLPDGGRA